LPNCRFPNARLALAHLNFGRESPAAMVRPTVLSAVVLAASSILSAACPCCPTCVVCPCACPTCGIPVPPVTQPPLTPPPKKTVEPLLTCDLNCYGDSSTPVPLPGGDGNGVKVDTIEACRQFCFATEGCEGVVFGESEKMCWGKKNIRTSKCQLGDGYTTELLTKMPFGTCTIMGDPHVLTFDDPAGQQGTPAITQTTPGDYYLVTSEDIKIQGRFGYSSRFPAAASLTGIAVSGVLIHNNKLVVEYTGPAKGKEGFKAWWNDQPILDQGFPASFKSKDNFLEAEYNSMDPQSFSREARNTIGGTSGDLPSYLFKIAPGIQIYVLMGQETMNGVITMRKLRVGMDGYCGNFNCVANDDGLQALEARNLTTPIAAGTSLFKNAPAQPSSQLKKSGETPQLNDCDPAVLKKAQDVTCANLEDGMKAGCIFDVCASGGSESMGNEDVAAAALAINADHATQMFGFLGPLFEHAEVPVPIQWTLGIFLVGMMVGSAALGVSSRRRGASSIKFLEVSEMTPEEQAMADEEEALLSMPAASEHEPLLA